MTEYSKIDKSATRREFIQSTATAGIMLGMGSTLFSTTANKVIAKMQDPQTEKNIKDKTQNQAEKKLKLLILGGTGFLGPHIVNAALERGHIMTLFNRGKTNPHLFLELEKLVGNRDPNKDEGLKALEGRKWDAVIDTSSYFPRMTKASTELLKDNINQYVLISSVSAYKDFATNDMDETAPVATMEDETLETITNGSYGPLKVLCEQAAENAMPGRVTNIRPGLIVGPRDISDRFTYWPVRVQSGGELIAPGSPTDPVQFIDARDLADFCIRAIEHKITGIYNAVGPLTRCSIADLLNSCKAVTGGDAIFTWIDAEFLESQQVYAWVQMPVWTPSEGDSKGINTISNKKSVAAGMKYRPMKVTIKDTLDWFNALPPDRKAKLKAGISAQREAEVLQAWHDRDK